MHATRQTSGRSPNPAGRAAAGQSLPTSEELYRRIVETTHEGIWMADLDWVTRFVNPQHIMQKLKLQTGPELIRQAVRWAPAQQLV